MGELTVSIKEVKVLYYSLLEVSMEERREHVREALSGSVTFEMSESLSKEFSVSPQRGEGDAIDVSEGGLSLFTKDAVEDGQIVRIKLPLPGMSIKTPTLVKVKWSKPYEKGYKVGVSFVL